MNTPQHQDPHSDEADEAKAAELLAVLHDDDVVIDLRDAEVMATHAPEVSVEDGQVVIDLRELAPTGRIIEPGPRMCGRPPDLLPGFELVRITGGDRWMDAEAFVYDIYRELEYTEESTSHQVEELARFRDNSHFHAVIADDGDGQIVGTIRAIFAPFEGLPVGKFDRVDFEDENPMCELSSIVVDPRVRSQGFIEHLYRAGWADALRSGANAITGLGEKWLLDTFRDTYGLPFVPVGVPEWYMGGEVIPMIMSTGPASAMAISRANPDFWAWSLETLTAEEIEALGYTPSIPAGHTVARSKT
ncbi:MAG: Acetyltransferase family protein [Acidimicrobiales bacterium]|nr:Acetyltransferase family protein [Acidimicrobiales bacterium]